MWWILDLIIAAIIIIYMFISAKRGFARTVAELVGYVLAIYIAFTFGGVLAEAVYDGAIEPAIVETVSEKVTVTANANIDETVDNIWNSLPGFISNTAENFSITPETLKTEIVEGYSEGATSATFAQSAADTIAQPIIVPLLKTVIGLILFVVLMFVVKILAKIINRAFSLPLIGGINRALGGIIGIFKGAIISAVFVFVVLFIISFTDNGFLIFTYENIEQSVLFKFLAGFSPFK